MQSIDSIGESGLWLFSSLGNFDHGLIQRLNIQARRILESDPYSSFDCWSSGFTQLKNNSVTPRSSRSLNIQCETDEILITARNLLPLATREDSYTDRPDTESAVGSQQSAFCLNLWKSVKSVYPGWHVAVRMVLGMRRRRGGVNSIESLSAAARSVIILTHGHTFPRDARGAACGYGSRIGQCWEISAFPPGWVDPGECERWCRCFETASKFVFSTRFRKHSPSRRSQLAYGPHPSPGLSKTFGSF